MTSKEITTIEPVAPQTRRPAAHSPRLVLSVLFHPDLSKVGARSQPFEGTSKAPYFVGRSAPAFVQPSGGSPTVLGDPCLSRKQLALYRAGDGTQVQIDACGARPVEAFSPDMVRREISGRALDLPLVIALGERLLLLLSEEPETTPSHAFGLSGQSAAVERLRREIALALDDDAHVLLGGETGAGKELVARALHDFSQRRSQPFVAVNCATLSEPVLESELFGHVRGAFTGATADRPGLLRAAASGTVFLDEIGELPLQTQARLLRALQERTVRPVGSEREHPFHARVVSATHRDLARDVAEERFRPDLYYRLATLVITVPPLRARAGDVPLLFVETLREQISLRGSSRIAQLWRPATAAPPPLPQELFRALLRHSWPGNVRELRTMAHRFCSLLEQRGVDEAVSELSGALQHAPRGALVDPEPSVGGARPIEASELERALEGHDFVLRRAAKALGMSHTAIDRHVRRLGLPRACDLEAAQIEDAAARVSGDWVAAARHLRISARSLKLRASALGLAHLFDSRT